MRRGRYQLSTAHAVYSFGDLYSNFAQTFKQCKLEDLPGKEVLVLGLGLGSIPYMLEKKLGLDLHYTAVEIDEVIIDLAYRYTLAELDSPIEIICTDAEIFVSSTYQRYDLICMDVFLDDQIPGPFQQVEFLEQLQRLLAPGGLLLFNVLALRKTDRKQAERFFAQVFMPVFPQSTFVEVEYNWVLVNERRWLR
jgi:spermidine synthase